MIEIKSWIEKYMQALDENFGARVWFVGLQGSYGRGEATETSDIDMVLILDELTAGDIKKYGAMLDELPNRELMCGFLSGKKEILNWDAADLFQFYHDTTPIKGSLDELLKIIDDAAVEHAIKVGAGNIYHGCVHNMLYGKSDDMVRGLYKSASFVVQAICFRQTGRYIKYQKELAEAVSGGDRVIVETFMKLKNGGEVEFEKMSEGLFDWAGRLIRN